MSEKKIKEPKKQDRKKMSDFTDMFTPKKNRGLRSNQHMFFTSLIIVFLFVWMIIYLVRFTFVDAPKVITSPYNKRTAKLSEHVVRGKILSANDKVLAETKVDDEGQEYRYYEYGSTFSHIVGYNKHGRAGIESAYNFELLTSHDQLVDQVKNDLKSRKSEGDSIVTTLDTRLQNRAQEALSGYRGAVVAIEPKTGKVRAMVSKPDFDPNELDDIWEEINSDPDNSCLLNRATQGLYEPGSTYKVLTALEYLREHPKGYEKFHYDCKGETVVNSVRISCYEHSEHGKVSLKKAMEKSCNTAFVTIGSKLNMASFADLNEKFLFGDKIKFDLSVIKSRFKLTANSDKSQIPQTVIGQGETLMSPFHNALIMCAIANDGVLMRPHVIDHIESNDGKIVSRNKTREYKTLLGKKEAGILKDMLRGVVTEGTGYELNTDEYKVAGKTGSAENAGENAHAWFVGYSGGDDPDLVVCVLVENVGAGSKYAAPIAREVFDCYYNNSLDEEYGD